jgi:hypothetical protein
MPKRTTGGTVRRPSPTPGGARRDDSGDEVLAAVLIRMWALASGRTLRSDVPPDQLSEEELIAFWADDMTPQAGRHARPDDPGRPAEGRAPGQMDGRAPQPHSRQRPAGTPGRSGSRITRRGPSPAPKVLRPP